MTEQQTPDQQVAQMCWGSSYGLVCAICSWTIRECQPWPGVGAKYGSQTIVPVLKWFLFLWCETKLLSSCGAKSRAYQSGSRFTQSIYQMYHISSISCNLNVYLILLNQIWYMFFIFMFLLRVNIYNNFKVQAVNLTLRHSNNKQVKVVLIFFDTFVSSSSRQLEKDANTQKTNFHFMHVNWSQN